MITGTEGGLDPAILLRLEVLLALTSRKGEKAVVDEIQTEGNKVRPGQVFPAPTEKSELSATSDSPVQGESKRNLSQAQSLRRIEQIVAQEALQRASVNNKNKRTSDISKKRVALSVLEPFVIEVKSCRKPLSSLCNSNSSHANLHATCYWPHQYFVPLDGCDHE